jgi:creatinine amidohydrolase
LVSLLAEIREHRAARLARRPAAPGETTPADARPFPSHRAQYLPSLSLSALAALPDKERLQVILPTASIEQHGHHLPVGVDSILGQAQLSAMLNEEGLPVLVAPPVTYGKSNEHTGFPGTLSIGAPALHRLVSSLVTQLHGLGFPHIRLFNTHGGNTAVLRSLVSAGGFAPGCTLSFLQGGFRPELPPQEAAWGLHADEWETSLMLACSPELVDMTKARCEYPARLEDPGLLRPEKAPATFAWLSRDVSQGGVMGDPTRASAEKGGLWLSQEGKSLREALLFPPK